MGIFFKKLNGLQKYQHFVFEAAIPGVVKAQLVANCSYTEFNLLKTRKASVSKITKEIKSFSILVLTPPPLDYKRQEYLYHNIRPFVRGMNLKILLATGQSLKNQHKLSFNSVSDLVLICLHQPDFGCHSTTIQKFSD